MSQSSDRRAAGLPAQPIVIQFPASGAQRAFTGIAWLGFLVCGGLLLSQWSARREYFDTTQGVQEQFHGGAAAARDKVAIIRVAGVIMEGDGFVKRQIDRVREDERVKAVVLRVDSPGGTVTGSHYLYHHLNKLRQERSLPLVVSMGAMAASGGYYVSMAVGDQERAIFAEPTTTTGSIGVIVPHYDFSGLLARLDVKDDSIASHPRKQLLSVTQPMSEEHRRIIDAYVGDSFARFKAVVKAGRPALRAANPGESLVDAGQGRDLATGEIFTATQAQELGLVDEIGFLEDAVGRACELAGVQLTDVRVVDYRRPSTVWELAGAPLTARTDGTLAALLELSVPQAYFLMTTLPTLASSRRAD